MATQSQHSGNVKDGAGTPAQNSQTGRERGAELDGQQDNFYH